MGEQHLLDYTSRYNLEDVVEMLRKKEEAIITFLFFMREKAQQKNLLPAFPVWVIH